MSARMATGEAGRVYGITEDTLEPRSAAPRKAERRDAISDPPPGVPPHRGAAQDLVRLILSRQSVMPKRLCPPGPTNDELRLMISAAVTAPDHGALRPWRFIKVADAARTALAEIFVEAKRRRAPDQPDAVLARERDKALGAPTLLAVCGRIRGDHPDVPDSEQFASIGAAIQNVLLTAHVLGFGAILLSGDKTRDPLVRAAFSLDEGERLVGFLSIGSPAIDVRAKPRPAVSNHLSEWYGPDWDVGR